MLYAQLTQLVENNKEFIRERVKFKGNNYEVFSYSLPSYTEFQLPGAIDCRGTVFQINDDGTATLVCLPMPKFFNIEEGIHKRAEEKVIIAEMVKYDGSMMKTIMINGQLCLMGKTKFNDGYHPHALHAENVLHANPNLASMLLVLENAGYTVCLEYVSGADEYICKAESEKLIILLARKRDTGEIMNTNDIWHFLKNAGHQVYREYLAAYTEIPERDVEEYTPVIRNRKDTEGSVVLVKNITTGAVYFAKVKTTDYLLKYHSRSKSGWTKDRICQAIIRKVSDDMKALHYKKPEKVQYIESLEECVRNKTRIILEDMAVFMARNTDKTGKDFSVAIQTAGIPKELHGLYFQTKKDSAFDSNEWFYNNTNVFKL